MNVNNEEKNKDILDFGSKIEDKSIKPGFRKLKFGGVYAEETKKPFEAGVTTSGNNLIKLYLTNGIYCIYDSLFLSAVAIPKLKNLYFELFNEQLTQKFGSIQELVNHLNQKFEEKYPENPEFHVKLTGEVMMTGTMYCQLPFQQVFVKGDNFVDRDFTEQEARFFIKKKNK